jgi:hypothetical protein
LRSKNSRFALKRFSDFAIERLRTGAVPGRRAQLHEVAQEVANRTGEPAHRVLQVLVEANHAEPGRSGDSASDIRLMKELERYVKEMGGVR